MIPILLSHSRSNILQSLPREQEYLPVLLLESLSMSPTLYNTDEDGFLYYSNLPMLTHSLLSCHLLTTAISYCHEHHTIKELGGMEVHFLKFSVSAFTFANWSAVETNCFISAIYRPWLVVYETRGAPDTAWLFDYLHGAEPLFS